ncbi:hypothetical protein Pla110_09240 [Polystyrenella longa]|uniref:Uncharacterized protein n=1 Tax=Polystyrenella longa TaxID=2528007 RepID=A0A518CJ09_9PLAN|nr:hypothetical protein [Polystyrenella longa]QDU79219.1 hypothetical protein Pla110_09240 [Polystyrenella longa]
MNATRFASCLIFVVSIPLCLVNASAQEFTDGETPATVSSASGTLKKNESLLKAPVKIEIKADRTVEEAIRDMAEAAGLTMELEGLDQKILASVYSTSVNQSFTIDAENFQVALNDFARMLLRNYEGDLNIEAVYRRTFLAVPTGKGMLIANPLVRMSSPCEQVTKIYALAELNVDNTSEESALHTSQLTELLKSHIPVYWRTIGFSGQSTHPLEHTFMTHQLNESESEAFEALHIASSITYLQVPKVLVIKAPRSVHYEITQLLEEIKESTEKNPSAPELLGGHGGSPR